ncbi:hypothetical protein [Pantoea agglomerans]|uniref:hypothetical protein n=1 Tax=Enterobacter agglomerans TaxID=549 RepID=UPI001786C38D|nr:hypothetical protein [Pantoea agglomerans]MBD8142263.1 hypothetical protein [Pantoea agglomerans]MBD8180593.1 hypothetical protein [Pantoea agglomerans]MBD8220642.1 hypothetical protein [Pantoea agglomerans]WVL81630.1 hypothetical protein IFT78_008100 [Pantoea agglomerans]
MGRVFNGKSLSVNKLRLTARAILPRYFFLPSTISFVLILFYPVFSYAIALLHTHYPVLSWLKRKPTETSKAFTLSQRATGLTQEMKPTERCHYGKTESSDQSAS